jgi:hypothetical protein
MEILDLQDDVAYLTGHALSKRIPGNPRGKALLSPAVCAYLTSLMSSKCEERPAAGPG